MLLHTQSNNWHGVNSWSLYGLASWHEQLVFWLFQPDYLMVTFHVNWLKMSLSFSSKIIFVVTQIQEILPVFVLWCSIIRKIDYFLRVQSSWWQLFQKGNERSLKKMGSYSIMVVKAVRNHHIAHLVCVSQIQVVGDKQVQGCLRVMPMESLGSILQNEIKKSVVISIFPIFIVALWDIYNDAWSVAMNEGRCKSSSYLLIESIIKFSTDEQNVSV